jgi:hypothetical protein
MAGVLFCSSFNMVFWKAKSDAQKGSFNQSALQYDCVHNTCTSSCTLHTGTVMAVDNDIVIVGDKDSSDFIPTNQKNTRSQTKLTNPDSSSTSSEQVEVKSDGKCVIIHTSEKLHERWRRLFYHRYSVQLKDLLSTKEFPTYDKGGALVDTKLLVQNQDSKLFMITFYHTKPKIMLQGAKAPHWFEMEFPELHAMVHSVSEAPIVDLCDKTFEHELDIISKESMAMDTDLATVDEVHAVESTTISGRMSGTGVATISSPEKQIPNKTSCSAPQVESLSTFATQMATNIVKNSISDVLSGKRNRTANRYVKADNKVQTSPTCTHGSDVRTNNDNVLPKSNISDVG